MKIGLVCPYTWDTPGGVRSHVADLALTLQEHGHKVSVLAPVDDPAGLPPWVVDGGRAVAVPYNGAVARMNFGVKAANTVRRWVRDGEFDVLHIHEPLAPGLSLLACWVARGPIVATWHSSHVRSRMLSAGYYIAQTAMEKVRGSIAVSEDARRTLVAHVGGDAVLIPNGVRVAAFASDGRLPQISTGHPTILFLGRIDEPRKGLDVLLDALPSIMAQVPNIRVYVAGPGDLGDQHEHLHPALAEVVTFLGRVSDEDKARALRSVDLYVAPHTGGESFGIVLIEAMAAETAVLASDLPAFRRVLEDGKSGALFVNEDSSDLAAQAVRLLGDSAAREQLVAAGRTRVREFDWDVVVDDVIAVYESVGMPGEKVTTDIRGQIVGRLGIRPVS
ncbi:MAG: glycosyltransferase family 1 protein [Candidatus Nanopelagicales bacterium]|nr:glycosyltransferase family 1 protein [Candidatus Nanopelagicales bacterium]